MVMDPHEIKWMAANFPKELNCSRQERNLAIRMHRRKLRRLCALQCYARKKGVPADWVHDQAGWIIQRILKLPDTMRYYA